MGLTLDKSPLKQPSHLLASPYPLTHPDRICTSPSSSFGCLPCLLPPHACPPLPPLPPPLPPALPPPPSGTRGDGPAGRHLDAGPPARAQSPRIQRGGARGKGVRERPLPPVAAPLLRPHPLRSNGRRSSSTSCPQQQPPPLLCLPFALHSSGHRSSSASLWWFRPRIGYTYPYQYVSRILGYVLERIRGVSRAYPYRIRTRYGYTTLLAYPCNRGGAL